MKVSKKIAFASAVFGRNFIWGVMLYYLLFFYTDVFGIGAAAAGTLFLIARIWDGVNDPIMGIIADKTHTRWGRFRPYILFVAFPWAAIGVLTFFTPDWDATGKLAWSYVTYIMAGMLFTAQSVPHWGLIPTLSKDQKDRSHLISLVWFFALAAYLIISTVAIPAVTALGGGTEMHQMRIGFPRFMLILAPISIPFALICFFNTKEEYSPPKEILTVKESIRLLGYNRRIFLLMTGLVFLGVSVTASGAVQAYYSIYNMNRIDLIPLFMFFNTGLTIIGALIAPLIIKRWGNKKPLLAGLLVQIILNGISFLISPDRVNTLLANVSLIGLAGGTGLVFIAGLFAQATDYIEKRSGKRIDGTIFSLQTLAMKIGTGLGGAMTGYGLQLGNYVPNALQQTEQALLGINILRFGMPAALNLIGFVAFLFYRTLSRDVNIDSDINQTTGAGS
jgi:sugar (glycoside-pentoside-hexuronide) transporter